MTLLPFGWGLSRLGSFVRSAGLFVSIPATLVLALLASGCATAGYQKGDLAARSLQNAAAAIQTEHRAIELAMAALDQLVTNPSGDLKPRFENYSKSLDWLVACAHDSDKAGLVIRQKHEAYFKAWDEELSRMTFEAVHNSSAARKDEVSGQFQTISGRFQQDQATVGPLINYFEDIRNALRADLTPGGLQAVKQIVANANANVTKVQSALDRLAQDLTASGSRLSSTILEAAR
jgi:Protein of unknown function (DUF2959)